MVNYADLYTVKTQHSPNDCRDVREMCDEVIEKLRSVKYDANCWLSSKMIAEDTGLRESFVIWAILYEIDSGKHHILIRTDDFGDNEYCIKY